MKNVKTKVPMNERNMYLYSFFKTLPYFVANITFYLVGSVLLFFFMIMCLY